MSCFVAIGETAIECRKNQGTGAVFQGHGLKTLSVLSCPGQPMKFIFPEDRFSLPATAQPETRPAGDVAVAGRRGQASGT